MKGYRRLRAYERLKEGDGWFDNGKFNEYFYCIGDMVGNNKEVLTSYRPIVKIKSRLTRSAHLRHIGLSEIQIKLVNKFIEGNYRRRVRI